MSSRYISIEEINSILAAIEDKSGIDLLKEVRDNTVQEEDVKKQQKKEGGKQLTPEEAQNETKERSFIGFAKEDDIAKDDDVKKGTLKRLADTGLIIKGGFIPRGEEIINSYKLTNEGFALLYLVDKINKRGGGGGGEEIKPEKPREKEEDPTPQRETRKQEREESRSKLKL